MYDWNPSPLLDWVKRSPAISHATVRPNHTSKSCPVLYTMIHSGDMFKQQQHCWWEQGCFPKHGFLKNLRQWNFLGQTSALGCEDFPTLRQPIPSPSSGRAGGLVALKQNVLILPNHQHTLEGRDGVTSWKVGKSRHPDAAFCHRKFHWILLLRNPQGVHYDKVWRGLGRGH